MQLMEFPENHTKLALNPQKSMHVFIKWVFFVYSFVNCNLKKKCPGLCNHFIQIQSQYFHNNWTLHNFRNLPKRTTFEIGTLPKVDKTQANPYMFLLNSFLSSV